MKYDPMRSSSYLELPKLHGCVNIQNNAEKCFLWSILALLFPLKPRNHPYIVPKYQEYEHELNISGLQYPENLKYIGKFKHQRNISVNVYGYKDKKIFPLRITTVTTARHHLDLLYITTGKISHHALMKDLSRLVLEEYNNDNNKRYFCQYCLHGCISEEVLKNDLGRRKLHGPQRIKLPEVDNKKGRDKAKFKKTYYQPRLPFVIYTDFESVLRKQDLCEPSSSKSFTTQYQHHIPCGRCIYVKCSHWWYFEVPQVNIGNDGTEKFLDQVLAAATICRQHLTNKIPMKRLTQEQWREYDNTTNCSICVKPFKSADTKVCDHNHLTSEYRGPALNACNLNYWIDPKKVHASCIMHHGYIMHHASMHHSQRQSYMVSMF